MQLNDWQKTVARIYGGGDYAHFVERCVMSHDDLGDCGDTLFTFLMLELSDAEDCNSTEEAVRRIESARDQLEDALRALEAS